MNSVTIASAVISKSFKEEEDAIAYIEGKNETTIAKFRVGDRVYDASAKQNRYINLDCKAFNGTAERMRKMRLDAGSYVDITGRLDVESWEAKDGAKHSRTVVLVERIDYSTGNPRQEGQEEAMRPASTDRKAESKKAEGKKAARSQAPAKGFQGYEVIDDEDNPFGLF